ncbi:hypothetical protein LCAA2362_2840 [Lacticaseibacillus casei A2-362]|uniref:hypothetical protein n=1 Tax=Lacticaseibacillus paracasei TaxID=1597 RepID=UPI0002973CF4|nr:hypothetical protein [Lacticaseibacillus paracasei]EKQ13018.1 hypothetical protein LCAA2362_2840 [Lacticaseibacillus casei A2-362]MDN4553324.1 hypothetical protein [Lacticaseibacillus paracasei]
MPNEKLDPWGKPIIDDEGDRNRVMKMLREKKEAADRSQHEQDKKRKAEESARQVEAKVKELESQDK